MYFNKKLFVGSAVLVAAFSLLLSSLSQAAVIQVGTDDVNAGAAANCDLVNNICPTLRDALDVTNNNGEADTIMIGEGTTLIEFGALAIDEDVALTIQGVNSNISILNADFDMNLVGDSRIFVIDGSSADVSINNLGFVSGFGSSDGGCIRFNPVANLTIENSSFLNCRAQRHGGAISVNHANAENINISNTSFSQCDADSNANSTGDGGAVYLAGGSFQFVNSEVTHSSALSGGAIYLAAGVSGELVDSAIRYSDSVNEGGGIASYADNLQIRRSTVHGNTAANNDEIANEDLGGGLYHEGTGLIISDSTFSNNHGESGGGAISLIGNASITNSTLSGNDGATGGALVAVGSELSLNHVTFLNNEASANAYNIVAGFVDMTFRNSLLGPAGPGDASGANCSFVNEVISLAGGNLVTDESCSFDAMENIITADLGEIGLDPVLRLNNGQTQTHALLAGSLAIDGGIDYGWDVDQRAVPRDSQVDIGAYEVSCGDGIVQEFNNETCDFAAEDAPENCNSSCALELVEDDPVGDVSASDDGVGDTAGDDADGPASSSETALAGGCSLVSSQPGQAGLYLLIAFAVFGLMRQRTRYT